MKRRWLIYVLVGIAFGVFDFYYQGFLPSSLGTIVHLILVLGVWLIPIVPIGLYEAKVSRSRFLPAWAGCLTWLTAVVFYYLYNAVKLAFLGVAGRPELHISQRHDPLFWENWKSVLQQDILGGIVEWSVVAIVGGLIIGYLAGWVYRRVAKVTPN